MGSYIRPKHCQHCDNPPCVKVFTFKATSKRTVGIVLIDNERCIGCRYIIAACLTRSLNWFEPKDTKKYKDVPYNVERYVLQKKGTVIKCTFSVDCLRKECCLFVYEFVQMVYIIMKMFMKKVLPKGNTGETLKLS